MRVCVCVCVHVSVCVHVCVFTCMRVHVCVSVHVWVDRCVGVCAGAEPGFQEGYSFSFFFYLLTQTTPFTNSVVCVDRSILVYCPTLVKLLSTFSLLILICSQCPLTPTYKTKVAM